MKSLPAVVCKSEAKRSGDLMKEMKTPPHQQRMLTLLIPTKYLLVVKKYATGWGAFQ